MGKLIAGLVALVLLTLTLAVPAQGSHIRLSKAQAETLALEALSKWEAKGYNGDAFLVGCKRVSRKEFTCRYDLVYGTGKVCKGKMRVRAGMCHVRATFPVKARCEGGMPTN